MTDIEGRMPDWYMYLDRYQAGSLFDSRIFPDSVGTFSLTARLFKDGPVLRPGFASPIAQHKAPAEVSVNYFPGRLIMVSLGFDKSVAESIGRPILGGRSNGRFLSDFGDPESVDSGIAKTTAYIYSDGTAVMTAERVGGNRGVLTGVMPKEATEFSLLCAAAVQLHLDKAA